MFGEGLRLAHDLDEIPALAPRRRLKWQQIQQADFLTLNEKRQALGYQPIDEDQTARQERKNSEDFERIHGYPQPRKPVGEGEGGRWTDGSADFLRPIPARVIRPGGGGGPRFPRRPGSGGGGRRGRNNDDEPNLPKNNPFPDRPHCVEQWIRAERDCDAEEQRILQDPSKTRNIDQFSFNRVRCIWARVSEDCGGFPTSGTKSIDPNYPNGCMQMTSNGTTDEEAPLLKKADEYFLQARFDEAIEACTQHIELNPSDVSGYFQRAKVFSFQKKYAESLADFDELLRLRPGNPIVFYHRGRDLAYAGYYEEAIRDFNSAEAVDPNFDVESIALLRAHCFVKLRRFEEALRDIEHIPDDGTLFTKQRNELLGWISRNR